MAARAPRLCFSEAAHRPSQAAIDAHYNLSATVPYHVLPPERFRWRDSTQRPWLAYNPAALHPESILYTIRQGNNGRLNLTGVPPSWYRSSVVWVERRHGHAGVRLEIHDAEDARPFFLRGVAHAVFVRYRTQRYKDVWLARLEEPLWEVQRDVAELLPALGEYTWALNGHVASVPLPTGKAHIPAADQERGQLAAVCVGRAAVALLLTLPTPGAAIPYHIIPCQTHHCMRYATLHHALLYYTALCYGMLPCATHLCDTTLH